MTDEEWKKLDDQDIVLSELEGEYKPVRFDPFIEFDPPVSFIKEVIKQLKQQAYGYQEDIRRQRAENFPTEGTEKRLSKTVSKIKSHQFRLDRRVANGNWSDYQHDGKIGEDQIRRAKEVPIESLYNGRLRKSGSNLVGLCPFHIERGASFYVYQRENRWHCFGACNRGGDSVDYIQLRDQIDFINAVKYLNNVN